MKKNVILIIALSLIISGCADNKSLDENTLLESENTVTEVTDYNLMETSEADDVIETTIATDDSVYTTGTERFEYEIPVITPEDFMKMNESVAEDSDYYNFIISDLSERYKIRQASKNGTISKELSEISDGLIHAETRDINTDGNPELLIIRLMDHSYFLDVYHENGDIIELMDTLKIGSLSDGAEYHIAVSAQNDKLIIEREFYNYPGYSSYGSDIDFYMLSEDGKFDKVISLSGDRHIGVESLEVNDEKYFAEEGEIDYDSVRESAGKLFDEYGIDYSEIKCGFESWVYGYTVYLDSVDFIYGIYDDHGEEVTYVDSENAESFDGNVLNCN